MRPETSGRSQSAAGHLTNIGRAVCCALKCSGQRGHEVLEAISDYGGLLVVDGIVRRPKCRRNEQPGIGVVPHVPAQYIHVRLTRTTVEIKVQAQAAWQPQVQGDTGGLLVLDTSGNAMLFSKRQYRLRHSLAVCAFLLSKHRCGHFRFYVVGLLGRLVS